MRGCRRRSRRSCDCCSLARRCGRLPPAPACSLTSRCVACRCIACRCVATAARPTEGPHCSCWRSRAAECADGANCRHACRERRADARLLPLALLRDRVEEVCPTSGRIHTRLPRRRHRRRSRCEASVRGMQPAHGAATRGPTECRGHTGEKRVERGVEQRRCRLRRRRWLGIKRDKGLLRTGSWRGLVRLLVEQAMRRALEGPMRLPSAFATVRPGLSRKGPHGGLLGGRG